MALMSEAELLAKYQAINPDPDDLKRELDDLRMLKEAVMLLSEQARSQGMSIKNPEGFLITASKYHGNPGTTQSDTVSIRTDIDRTKSSVDRINEALSSVPEISDEDAELTEGLV